VRKIADAPLSANDYLPSVMTCANYLKMPDYSDKDMMRKRLLTAMDEGKDSFLLS
jgi:E3 ubiquitin-protein ligase TRIP12